MIEIGDYLSFIFINMIKGNGNVLIQKIFLYHYHLFIINELH